MNDIEPKIKPLYRGLRELNIGNYLASADFDRYALRNGIEKIWNQAVEAYDRENNVLFIGHDTTSFDREEALRILMNWAIRSAQSDFNSIISIIISGFIEWNGQRLNFEKVFEDLELAGLPNNIITKLREKFESRNKIIAALTPNVKNFESEDFTQKKRQPNEFIESNKTAWIDQISKGETPKTLDDVKNFAHEVDNIEVLKTIVNLSSRWNRNKQSYNSGIIDNEEKEREINKVNDALIDLIFTLK